MKSGEEANAYNQHALRTLGEQLSDDFDAEMYYAHTVGIFVNENLKPQKVVLRAYGVHADIDLTDLPIGSYRLAAREESIAGNKIFSNWVEFTVIK